jgi:FAD/FMN-containing dehydrogenase
MAILPRLIKIVGEERVVTDEESLLVYGRDWTRFYQPAPLAVVFVRTSKEVIQLVALARTQGIGLVPSGGRTGLSGGACAVAGEVVVSFEKMNQILEFDVAEGSVTLEPGVVTGTLQAFAAERGLFYPVDFASSGSSQIGGNIATNAGGIRVIRYGLTRQQVTGLKVVTGAGELLELNKGLTKNATGYDLRHLFIGSEGTLGFITEATIALSQAPMSSRVILLAIPKMKDCLPILASFKQHVTLNAFEFFSQNALQHVMLASGLGQPMDVESAFYVLLEFEQRSEQSMDDALTAFSECTGNGWVVDGIVASSDRQSQELWRYREAISESITPRTPYKNDISVRIGQIPAFLDRVDKVVSQAYPEFDVVWFGHIGDGNVHLNILRPESWDVERFKQKCETVSRQVLEVVQRFNGSISAEHGVGLLKRDQLGFSRSETEITAMRSIKAVFDPDGVMNPGKVFPQAPD